jgi:hypothetical protein
MVALVGMAGLVLLTCACQRQTATGPGPGNSAAAAAIHTSPTPAPSPVATAPVVSAIDAIDEKACQFARAKIPSSDNPAEPDELPSYLARSIVTASGERLQITSSGTMLDDTLRSPDSRKDVNFTEEPGEETRWDKGLYFLPFSGRIYLLSFVGNKPAYLHALYRLTPDHRGIPLCLYRPKVNVSLMLGSGSGSRKEEIVAAFKLCAAVSQNKVSYLKERPYQGAVPRGQGGLDADAQARVTVDYRNDGKPARLVRVEYSSGAGAGCERSGFILPPHAGSAAERRLDALQDRTPSYSRPANYYNSCRDAPERWFRYNGRNFLEMRSASHLDPYSEEAEYWLVSSVVNGRAERICEASYLREPPAIIARWDGHDWLPRQKPAE